MVGGATLATVVRVLVVTGTELLSTGGAGRGVADVVGAVLIWVLVGATSCVVVAVAALTGGGGGNADRLGFGVTVAVGDIAVDVGVGAVPLPTSGVTGVSVCRSPPKVSRSAPVGTTNVSPPSNAHQRARRPRRSVPVGGGGSGAESTVSVVPVGMSPPPTPPVRVDPTELAGPGIAVFARGAPRVFQPYPPPSYP